MFLRKKENLFSENRKIVFLSHSPYILGRLYILCSYFLILILIPGLKWFRTVGWRESVNIWGAWKRIEIVTSMGLRLVLNEVVPCGKEIIVMEWSGIWIDFLPSICLLYWGKHCVHCVAVTYNSSISNSIIEEQSQVQMTKSSWPLLRWWQGKDGVVLQ